LAKATNNEKTAKSIAQPNYDMLCVCYNIIKLRLFIVKDRESFYV